MPASGGLRDQLFSDHHRLNIQRPTIVIVIGTNVLVIIDLYRHAYERGKKRGQIRCDDRMLINDRGFIGLQGLLATGTDPVARGLTNL
jgi:hypothetical protein